MITKHAEDLWNCRGRIGYYPRARDGMYDFLRALRKTGRLEYILLPSYIGYSPKDGSGVYDPVARVDGLKYRFYRVGQMLYIDMENVRAVLESVKGHPFLLLRMDYYGFTDPGAVELYNLVHEYGGYVLEDNAHSVPSFQDLFGFYSDAAFYATHKFLPLPAGGVLMVRNPKLMSLELNGASFPQADSNLWEYDFMRIAGLRRKNFQRLEEYCKPYMDHFQPMRSLENDSFTIPYSFPVILKHDDRFALYNFLNDNGYGVTCLYYQMIEQIPTGVYPESKYLSDHILNFAVHQDVNFEEYPQMLEAIERYYRSE